MKAMLDWWFVTPTGFWEYTGRAALWGGIGFLLSIGIVRWEWARDRKAKKRSSYDQDDSDLWVVGLVCAVLWPAVIICCVVYQFMKHIGPLVKLAYTPAVVRKTEVPPRESAVKREFIADSGW